MKALLLPILSFALITSSQAQAVAVIPANEAAAHVNAWATVEGVVAKVFTSKSGNTFLNIGASYHQTVSSNGQLKRDPYWDPLRNDPRFDKLLAELAPKD